MLETTSQEKQLLVVGGMGFIGQWVVLSGVKRGYNVYILSRNTQEPLNNAQNVNYLKADLLDYEAVLRVLHNKKITHVVNLGGDINHSQFRNGGKQVIDAHFNGMLNLVHCLNWDYLKCFVQIGSSDEYGNAPAPQHEDQICVPISNYSLAKLAANEFLQMLYRTENFPAIVLRLFLVYGPGQDKQRFLPQIISACINNETFPTSYGEQLRDFCYVEDIANGIFLALESKKCYGQIFNLGSGNPVSIHSMIERVVNIVNAGLPDYGKFPYRVGENIWFFISPTLL